MAVLGIAGLFATESEDYPPGAFTAFYHDAAACLVSNGSALAAIEEERFSREKHTNRFPVRAIRECLSAVGLRPADLTQLAYFFEEQFTDHDLMAAEVDDPLLQAAATPSREMILGRVSDALDYDCRELPLHFTTHHDAHAASAFYDSGFDSALVVVADGNGERDGVTVYLASQNGLNSLRRYPRADSLGHFYTAITKLIGYRDFDEYKVMGLASFGTPGRWRDVLRDLWDTAADGVYRLDHRGVAAACIRAGMRPRRARDPIQDTHRDLAAAAQEVLELIATHIIKYWLVSTGARRLCLAGGVAQNTTLNGKLLSLPFLDSVYVPAAAHDAGAALGAAILADLRVRAPAAPIQPATTSRYCSTAFLGAALGDDGEIGAQLKAWGDAIEVREVPDIADLVAGEVASGAVVGWAQGRAEFGPRALGNRSILADPRPAANRDRVNLLVKRREDYRPFAPVVIDSEAGRFFDLPPVSADYSFMSYVVPVLPEMRETLGAVTHVDGTARVQILTESGNPLFYRLLRGFGDRTGIPVLLNTSFNNYAEPIVQSVDDAVACLLTTGLSMLAIGRYAVAPAATAGLMTRMRVEIMPFCQLVRIVSRQGSEWAMIRTSTPAQRTPVSTELADVLVTACGSWDAGVPESRRSDLAQELWRLWDRRLIRLVRV